MKHLLSLLFIVSISSSGHASNSIGFAPGLADLMLLQFQCTIQSQEIDPNSGKMGASFSNSYIVVANDVKDAKAVALNKLNFYGPNEGSLWYLGKDNRQFTVKSISCH